MLTHKIILFVLFTIIASCIASGDVIDYKAKLISMMEEYFPIRKSFDYVSIEDIRSLTQINDPIQFTSILLNLLKDKDLPPSDLLPADLKSFTFGYIVIEILRGIKTNDDKMKLIQLCTLMNRKNNVDYLFELPSTFQLIYEIIINNKESGYDFKIKEFISSLPEIKIILLADIKYSLLYINMLSKEKYNQNEKIIDPNFFEIAYKSFININNSNYKEYYNDIKLFPGLRKDLIRYKVEYMIFYEKITKIMK